MWVELPIKCMHLVLSHALPPQFIEQPQKVGVVIPILPKVSTTSMVTKLTGSIAGVDEKGVL